MWGALVLTILISFFSFTIQAQDDTFVCFNTRCFLPHAKKTLRTGNNTLPLTKKEPMASKEHIEVAKEQLDSIATISFIQEQTKYDSLQEKEHPFSSKRTRNISDRDLFWRKLPGYESTSAYFVLFYLDRPKASCLTRPIWGDEKE